MYSLAWIQGWNIFLPCVNTRLQNFCSSLQLPLLLRNNVVSYNYCYLSKNVVYYWLQLPLKKCWELLATSLQQISLMLCYTRVDFLIVMSCCRWSACASQRSNVCFSRLNWQKIFSLRKMSKLLTIAILVTRFGTMSYFYVRLVEW